MNRVGFNRHNLLTLIIVALVILTFAASAWAVKPGTVNTVLGSIPVEKLGQTLVHEHFIFQWPGYLSDETIAPYDKKAVTGTSLNVIKLAQRYGYKTIIDATPNDGGRMPDLYKDLAKKTGFNIICSTGLYTEHHGSPAYWQMKAAIWGKDLPTIMSELFITEIEKGIGNSGVKAGVIKVASSKTLTDYEKAVHKAAAIAQKSTGVPIITHNDVANGVEQAEFLISQGADPNKVMIGHVSNSKDTEYHKAILEKGVYIAFDRVGQDHIMPFDDIVKSVSELCKLGYANKIMLSHDTVNSWHGRQDPIPEKLADLLKDWNVGLIPTKFIPALKGQGVTDEQIKMMVVENPKKLFLGI